MPRVPQEPDDAGVVIVVSKLEVEVQAAIGPKRVVVRLQLHVFGVADRPAGERAGRLPNVLLCVVAHAHREQLQQLSSVVLVDGPVVIVVVVEPDDHGWVFGQLDKQRRQAPKAVLSEHLYLIHEHLALRQLGVARGEDAVPKERHLLDERRAAVYHAVQPIRREPRHPKATGVVGMIPPQEIHLDAVRPLGIEKHIHGGIVAMSRVLLDLRPRRAEPRSSHQMRYQFPIVIRHRLHHLRILHCLRTARHSPGGMLCGESCPRPVRTPGTTPPRRRPPLPRADQSDAGRAEALTPIFRCRCGRNRTCRRFR